MNKIQRGESCERVGHLMGRFFTELTSEHGCDSTERVEGIVDSALVLLEQVRGENVSPEFADFLRYVIKKSGEQKKIDLRLKRSRASHRRVAA